MAFDRKPFLDRVIIEVTPLEKIFEQGAIELDLQSRHTHARSDRGLVRAVGDVVTMAGVAFTMPVQVGDEVFFDADTAEANRIFLQPSDQYKADLPKYIELRVGDLLGRTLREGELL